MFIKEPKTKSLLHDIGEALLPVKTFKPSAFPTGIWDITQKKTKHPLQIAKAKFQNSFFNLHHGFNPIQPIGKRILFSQSVATIFSCSRPPIICSWRWILIFPNLYVHYLSRHVDLKQESSSTKLNTHASHPCDVLKSHLNNYWGILTREFTSKSKSNRYHWNTFSKLNCFSFWSKPDNWKWRFEIFIFHRLTVRFLFQETHLIANVSQQFEVDLKDGSKQIHNFRTSYYMTRMREEYFTLIKVQNNCSQNKLKCTRLFKCFWSRKSSIHEIEGIWWISIRQCYF